jgi:hypothetical protein
MATLYTGRCAGCRKLTSGSAYSPLNRNDAARSVADMARRGDVIETHQVDDASAAPPIFRLEPCECPQKGGA